MDLGTKDKPRPVNVAKEMPNEDKKAMIDLLMNFRDVFACLYEDIRRLDPQLYQHKIHLSTDAKPVAQRRYRMNPNYAAKVKEEIDKLLKVGFIRPIKQATWLSPIVVVPKKNRQNPSMRRLSKVKCSHSNRCVLITVHRQGVGRGSRTQSLQLLRWI